MSVIENSVWPNGLKEDNEGYAVFYPLGTNKIDITTVTWPDGDKLISPFVYKNDELVGFCDTKAMTVSGSATTTMNYSHIEADFSSISDGKLTVNAPNATVKKFSWSVVDSGDDNVIVTIKYKGCKNVDDIKAVDPDYLTNDIIDGVWSEGLGDLEDGHYIGLEPGGRWYTYFGMFQDSNLVSFTSDLSGLTIGEYMFSGCSQLTSFSSDMPSLTHGRHMFRNCSQLTSFSSDMPSLTDGESMFSGCSQLTSFNSDLSSLTNGYYMFNNCNNLKSFTSDLSSLMDGDHMFYKASLESFNGDLSSLTNGYDMFGYCTNLVSFTSDLSSLTEGAGMFNYCKLDTDSVQIIANTINTPSSKGAIHIGIDNSTPNSQEKAAFNKIASKNWSVYVGVNGGRPSEWTPTSLIPIDGEETTTPIPFWAKPVPSDEKHARYTDSEGNFYIILGGNYIYGDDLSTYGMFTCEADAAANMRLTKIEK